MAGTQLAEVTENVVLNPRNGEGLNQLWVIQANQGEQRRVCASIPPPAFASLVSTAVAEEPECLDIRLYQDPADVVPNYLYSTAATWLRRYRSTGASEMKGVVGWRPVHLVLMSALRQKRWLHSQVKRRLIFCSGWLMSSQRLNRLEASLPFG